MKEKPLDGDHFCWEAFCNFCDQNGIPDDRDDWAPWWHCWKSAINAEYGGC
jgi:hypothetical protein